MVDIDVKFDTKMVEKMLKKYPERASKEYRSALTRTSVFGLREIKKASPVVTGNLKNHWRWAFTGPLISGITNNTNYIVKVNYVKRSNKPYQTKNKKDKNISAGLAVLSSRITRSKIDGYHHVENTVPMIDKFFKIELDAANRRILG